jgi:3-phenylpropionate/trans-cinnamate dioxygenase ferredoxin subunit
MVEGEPVVLANVDGQVFALKDQCSHEEFPLSDGEVEGSVVVCQYHGARFDLATGAPRGLPAVKPVKSYAVEVRENEIFVRGT